MPLLFVRNDITKMEVDAIVNAANSSLLGGGGVDGAIHRAAGPGLLEECRTLHGCGVGGAKLTGGYGLPCRYVIHAVGPVWRGGERGERDLLASCYSSSLALAAKHGCESVAFPLISAGAYGYPKEQALRIAVDAIGSFLLDHDMTVYLVAFDKDVFRLSKGLAEDIKEYINDRYVEEHGIGRRRRRRRRGNARREERPVAEDSFLSMESSASDGGGLEPAPEISSALSAPLKAREKSLKEVIGDLDEGFSEMLFRKIEEKGMTPAQCYKKANITRQHFSKIKNDKSYRPNKQTVLAFGVALELPLEEIKDMLMKAGFALSRSSVGDIIVEYFLEKGNYDIYEINEALYEFDQSLLGSLG